MSSLQCAVWRRYETKAFLSLPFICTIYSARLRVKVNLKETKQKKRPASLCISYFFLLSLSLHVWVEGCLCIATCPRKLLVGYRAINQLVDTQFYLTTCCFSVISSKEKGREQVRKVCVCVCETYEINLSANLLLCVVSSGERLVSSTRANLCSEVMC